MSILTYVNNDAIEVDGLTMSNDIVPYRQRHQKMVQNVLVIWLDNTSTNCYNSIDQLRLAIHTIEMFTDTDQCIDFLTDVSNEKVCMIISGTLCQQVIPLIHTISRLHSIIVFCENQASHEQWAKNWCKIKGIYAETASLNTALEQVTQQCEQNSVSISFLPSTTDVSNRNLDQLDPLYMYTQILKEILLTIKYEEKHFMEFIEYCRDALLENQTQLKILDKLQRQYSGEGPIRGYTSEYFLYSTLNRALRLMDTRVIIKFGVFIHDLHYQIEQLHKEQFGDHSSIEKFKVYRGQGMSTRDFEQLLKNKGGLIAFNSFLSTSKDEGVSRVFAESNRTNPDFVGILFVLTINPLQSSTPFDSIKNKSHFQEEDEVLFAMNIVFRIGDITSLDETNRLFQVDLTLTSNRDEDLRLLTDYIREQTFPNVDGWYRLGEVLLVISRFTQAEKVYEILLSQTSDENNRVNIYHRIGTVKFHQGEYEPAITFYEKALEVYRKKRPFTDSHCAIAYNDLGLVYYNIGRYSEAVSYYEKVLDIQQRSLSVDHLDLVLFHNNIGLLYAKMGEYSKALSSHEKALKIQQQSLPVNHPDLAGSYNNIGNVYVHIGEHSKALSYYEDALKIRQRALPPNHPQLSASYHNIGNIYFIIGKYSQALTSYERALQIKQKSLPLSHTDFSDLYNNIGSVYETMGEYQKALAFHEKALEIQQKSLPQNHLELATSYHNIGIVYQNMSAYSKALVSFTKALEIKQQSLPSNHPDLASNYNNIGTVYNDMREYDKALLYYEKAITIKEQSFFPTDPMLAMSYNNISNVYLDKCDYSKALFYAEKGLEIRHKTLPPQHPDLALSYETVGRLLGQMGDHTRSRPYLENSLNIRQQSLPPNHPALAISHNNIGIVYKNIGEYSKAISHYEKALEIGTQTFSPNNPNLAIFCYNISNVCQIIGEYEKARAFFERALQLEQKSLLSNHAELQTYKMNLDEGEPEL